MDLFKCNFDVKNPKLYLLFSIKTLLMTYLFQRISFFSTGWFRLVLLAEPFLDGFFSVFWCRWRGGWTQPGTGPGPLPRKRPEPSAYCAWSKPHDPGFERLQ